MEFYKKNPFIKPVTFRLQDFNTGLLSPQEQFVKNLIAYAYFIFKAPIYILSSKEKFSQNEMFEMYQNLELYTYLDTKNPNLHTSLLGIFWDYEIIELQQHKDDPKVKPYFDAVLDFHDTIQKIDAIIEHKTPFEKSKLQLEVYFKQNNIKTEYLEVQEIELLFYSISSIILSNLALAALKDFSFINKHLPLLLIEENIKQLKHYLNPRLLTDVELQQLHQASFNWFEQNLQKILFFLEIENEYGLFDELRSKFLSILRLDRIAESVSELTNKSEQQSNLMITTPTSLNYPIRVFKTPEAYHFFDTCAKQLTSIQMISFLYRRMAEQQGLIYLKDKAFRDWFNEQDYPASLDYPTATYERAATEEREQLLGLLEQFYGLEK